MSHVTARESMYTLEDTAGKLHWEAGGANGVVWAGFKGAASLRCRRLLLVCVCVFRLATLWSHALLSCHKSHLLQTMSDDGRVSLAPFLDSKAKSALFAMSRWLLDWIDSFES